jgi:hypothetical protein
MRKNLSISILFLAVVVSCGCEQKRDDSDKKQQDQQEVLLQEASAQTGMPAIKNFRERKILKDILELRDQEGLVTYTYIENMNPTIIPGRTALGGKLTYLGESVGYGIPYATQYTNPLKVVNNYYRTSGNPGITIAQADPSGLFSPASAEGTWVLLKDPEGNDVKPVYLEPRVVVSPFKFRLDGEMVKAEKQ